MLAVAIRLGEFGYLAIRTDPALQVESRDVVMLGGRIRCVHERNIASGPELTEFQQ